MAANYGMSLYKDYELLYTKHEALLLECSLLKKEYHQNQVTTDWRTAIIRNISVWLYLKLHLTRM